MTYLNEIHEGLQLKNLENASYFYEILEDVELMIVHELYTEFAEWHIAHSEEDANKAKCLYYIGGERLPTILKKGRADKCWEELSRIFLRGLEVQKTLPPHPNEWANVVVLQLEKCPDLTSLNLHGMKSLQHLTVKFCGKLEKIEVSVEEQCLRDLRYVQLEANYVLKSIPRIWRCAELVCVDIAFCPKLLLQSMDAEACPKLERLSTEWSCWTRTGIAKIALTQNLQELRINGSAQRSFEDPGLEKLVDIEDVQESGLNEALYPVLVLNKASDEGQSSTKQYGCNLRVLRLSNLFLLYSKFLSTLSGLQELRLDEVHLLDKRTLCLEGCIHLEVVGIGGGNVHTVSGIGELRKLGYVELYSMKDLRYLPDWPRRDETTRHKKTRRARLYISSCDKMDTTVLLQHNHYNMYKYNYCITLALITVVSMVFPSNISGIPVADMLGDIVDKASNFDFTIPRTRRRELANRRLHLGM